MATTAEIQLIMTRKGLDFDSAVRFYWFLQEGYTQERAMRMCGEDHPKPDPSDKEEHPK
jgi:hypothetical protein